MLAMLAALAICGAFDVGRSWSTGTPQVPAAQASQPTDATATKPAADKPAATKPAADKPAATKPAADKPAADKPAAENGADKAAPAPTPFIRVRRSPEKMPLALETSITRYVPKDAARGPLEIDLVGVVHIGERSYYEELNQLFQKYDVVLYELVAPEGTRVPKGGGTGGSAHPVSALQQGMKTMLALDFQLERVDYTVQNFVHADMTPEEMSKSMSDRQESWSQMFFRMIGQGIAQQSKQQPGGDFALLGALFAKDRPLRLKRILAQQFEDMDASLAALEGPEGSTLITQRNKKALQVLERELKGGKRRIAIFYGAGHMVDMEKRLLADFGLRRADEKWLTAWNMEPPK